MPVYDRNAVIAYAEKWAFGRNPRYYNFDRLGGDCTNFASQCVYAGAKIMNYTPVTGWFYRSANDRTASWTGVEFFYKFMVNNRGPGPYMEEAPLSMLLPGDIVQLKFESMDRFSHSPVVVAIGPNPGDPSDIYVATHTFDSYMRPLSTYIYEKVRGLHVVGVRG